MPLQIDRPSLKTSLSQRYATQHIGGAYDDRNIPTVAGTRGSAGGEGFGLQEKLFTTALFRIGSWAFLQQSNFKNEGNNLSSYVKGLDTNRYK